MEDSCHIVLRTLRRWLPRFPKIATVVLYTEQQFEAGVYAQFLPLYFPRNYTDARNGMALVQDLPGFNFGTETGEEIQEEGRSLKKSYLVLKREEDAEERDDEPIFDSKFEERDSREEAERLSMDLWSAKTPDDLVHM